MTPDAVVCWKWTQPGYRSTFGPKHVNTLRRMVARRYPHPHRFICVTDDARGIDPEVTVLPDFGDFAGLPSPHGGRYPSCYRRLRMFHPDAATWFGKRFVALDLDTVITGDLEPLWDRAEDFMIWGNTNPTTLYNGSMMLIRAGARPRVWTEFDPARSPIQAKSAGQHGSDQGWISYVLGKGETTWGRQDGVYSFRVHLQNGVLALPQQARVVFFHGAQDPWSPAPQRLAWVKEHYH